MNEETTSETVSSAPAVTPSTPEAPIDAAFEQKRKTVGILSYISILVVAAYFMANGDKRLMFHVKQGVVLFVCEIAVMVVAQMLLWTLSPIISILNIALFVLMIIGIMNVLNGKEKELPVIGQFATHVPL